MNSGGYSERALAPTSSATATLKAKNAPNFSQRSSPHQQQQSSTSPAVNINATRQIVGKYELGRVLAAGDFDCRTRLCSHVVTGAQYVVRIYSKVVLAEVPWMWQRVRESIQVQRTLPKHDNITEMVECFETATSLYILMHWFPSANVTRLFTCAMEEVVQFLVVLRSKAATGATVAAMTAASAKNAAEGRNASNSATGNQRDSDSVEAVTNTLDALATGARASASAALQDSLSDAPITRNSTTLNERSATATFPAADFTSVGSTAGKGHTNPAPMAYLVDERSVQTPRGGVSNNNNHHNPDSSSSMNGPTIASIITATAAGAPRLPVDNIRHLFVQVVKGVLHLHAHNVAHTGLAPDHILVSDRGLVKVSGLISCCVCPPETKLREMRGTQHTVAPEILQNELYDPYLADAWSLGVVLFFMLNDGRYPHDSANVLQHILFNHIRAPKAILPRTARDLLSRLLQPNPTARLTVAGILRHPFCAEASGIVLATTSTGNTPATSGGVDEVGGASRLSNGSGGRASVGGVAIAASTAAAGGGGAACDDAVLTRPRIVGQFLRAASVKANTWGQEEEQNTSPRSRGTGHFGGENSSQGRSQQQKRTPGNERIHQGSASGALLRRNTTVDSYWDPVTDSYSIELPLGLSREEEAAFLIQHRFRAYLHRRWYRQVTRAMSGNTMDDEDKEMQEEVARKGRQRTASRTSVSMGSGGASGAVGAGLSRKAARANRKSSFATFTATPAVASVAAVAATGRQHRGALPPILSASPSLERGARMAGSSAGIGFSTPVRQSGGRNGAGQRRSSVQLPPPSPDSSTTEESVATVVGYDRAGDIHHQEGTVVVTGFDTPKDDGFAPQSGALTYDYAATNTTASGLYNPSNAFSRYSIDSGGSVGSIAFDHDVIRRLSSIAMATSEAAGGANAGFPLKAHLAPGHPTVPGAPLAPLTRSSPVQAGISSPAPTAAAAAAAAGASTPGGTAAGTGAIAHTANSEVGVMDYANPFAAAAAAAVMSSMTFGETGAETDVNALLLNMLGSAAGTMAGDGNCCPLCKRVPQPQRSIKIAPYAHTRFEYDGKEFTNSDH